MSIAQLATNTYQLLTNNHQLKTIFMGTSDFAVPILESLITADYQPMAVITAPDKPVGRKQIITPPPVKISALKHNIPVLQPEKIRNLTLEIRNLKPDLIIVAAYGQIIPRELLDIPKYGCLNIHPSLLPKYRGPSPIQYTILNGDEETGVSIILMNEKIDAGLILGRFNLPRRFNLRKLNYEELSKELANLGAKLLIEIIPKWVNGQIKPIPQEEAKATYTKILKKEDGQIDWKNSAEYIERQIRAFNPWPGTFTSFKIKNQKSATAPPDHPRPRKRLYLAKIKNTNQNSKLLKIIKAKLLTISEQEKKIPGKVFLNKNNEATVACGQDALILEEVQPEGKRKMTSVEFLHGHPNFIGETLI